MPPPLEDMSEHLKLTKAAKERTIDQIDGTNYADKTPDHVEEVRLAPKKAKAPA